MVIFEIIDGAVSGSGSDSHDTSIQGTVRELESFAGDIGQSLDGARPERAVVVFEDRGIGIRFGNSRTPQPTRGVEIEGDTSTHAISVNLY